MLLQNKFSEQLTKSLIVHPKMEQERPTIRKLNKIFKANSSSTVKEVIESMVKLEQPLNYLLKTFQLQKGSQKSQPFKQQDLVSILLSQIGEDRKVDLLANGDFLLRGIAGKQSNFLVFSDRHFLYLKKEEDHGYKGLEYVVDRSFYVGEMHILHNTIVKHTTKPLSEDTTPSTQVRILSQTHYQTHSSTWINNLPRTGIHCLYSYTYSSTPLKQQMQSTLREQYTGDLNIHGRYEGENGKLRAWVEWSGEQKQVVGRFRDGRLQDKEDKERVL